MSSDTRVFPSYESMTNHGWADPAMRVDPIGNTSFFIFRNQDASQESKTGWKFHISVAHEDIPRAWDIVAQAVIDYDISTAKVVKPPTANEFNKPENPQAGKMITVYNRSESVDWDAFAHDVEQRLSQQGVQPGHTVKGDRPVSGSQYITYRNDGTAQGGLGRDSSQGYNPENLRDPWQSIDVSDVYQREPSHALSATQIVAEAGEWQHVHSLKRGGERKMANTGHRVDITDMNRGEMLDLLGALHDLGLELDNQLHHPDIDWNYKGSDDRTYLVVHAPSDAVINEAKSIEKAKAMFRESGLGEAMRGMASDYGDHSESQAAKAQSTPQLQTTGQGVRQR